jgi:serine protease AprX
MMKKSVPFKIVRRLGLLFLLAIIGAFPPQIEALPVIETIQPDLLQIIDTAPASIVSVIVQQKFHNEALAEQIGQLRGKVTKNLPIINAFAAELPAWQVTHLAQNANIRWISLDAPVVDTACTECVNTNNLVSAYNRAIRADQVWNEAPYRQGQNVTVAVVDSGIQKAHPDFGSRVVKSVNIAYPDMIFDNYGHGTYVAGIIGGNGSGSKGAYVGVAPKVNLLDVRVTSMAGAATESDVVAGLQWIYDHRAEHNIRVVNLSFNASQAQSYHTSPLNAACEVLWFNGVVVVAAAGNQGMGAIYPPANDPFVITVGAADDKGTATLADDQVAAFSAYGVTPDGVAKPDLIAPGRNLVGPLNNLNGLLALLHPQNLLSKSNYFRMSGTSAAAPVVSGAIALLLQAEPLLTPDQVKQRLLTTANKAWNGYDSTKAGAGYLDIYAAIHSKNLESANTGLRISKLLQSDATKGTGQNTLWDSVTWSTVTWSTVTWSTVTWSTVTWSSDYWEIDGGAMRTREQVADDFATMTVDELSFVADENQEPTLTKIFLPVVLTE